MNKLKSSLNRSGLWWLLLTALSLILCPSWAAFADPSTAVGFTPPSSDYSVSYLENLFGNVDGVLYGTGSQLMGAIFKVFNGAVLALGGIVISYTLLVGTMNTAHEGKMLGQKWSSIWVPIRSTIGLALLLPKTSGYCLMQVFVMWVIVQGVGAADKIWNAALDYLNSGGVIIRANMNTETSTAGDTVTTTAGDTDAISTGALAILAGQTCMLGLQEALNTLRQSYLDQKNTGSGPCVGEPSSAMNDFCDTPVPDFLASFNAVTYQNDHKTQTTFTVQMPNFESGTKYTYLNNICGSITWNAIPEADLNAINSNISGLSTQDQTSTSLSRATAIQQMYLDLAPTAQLMVDNDPALTPSSDSSHTDAYPGLAKNVFGVPYLSSGNTPCTQYSSDCVLWGGAYGSNGKDMYPALFQGNEIDNAVATYNAVMASTVELISDAKSNGDYNNGRDFIEQAKTSGWVTAGSYFFDLVYLNGSASASSTTDTNTGLEKSQSTPTSLLQGFGGDDPNKCNTTGETPSQYGELCTWYAGNTTAMDNVTRLVSNGSNEQPSTKITDTSTAVSGQAASTVYGFVQNALLMVQPEEPPMAAPVFAMNFNFKFNTSLFALPEKSFSCGPTPITHYCLGRMLADAIYNQMIRGIFNYLILGFSEMINIVILAAFTLPLSLFSLVFQAGLKYISNPGANPIVSMAAMGTAYVNYSFQMWIDLFTICITMLSIPVFGIILGPIGVLLILLVSPILIAWSGVLIAIGFSTAYYVPFLPYMLFIFGVIGWLTAVIEAMVAAPIVALGMTHPEGEGVLGKAEQGIMILMNVFLRPAMMVIGYLIGIALCYVSIWVLNEGYQHVAQFIQGDAHGHPWKGGNGYNNWAGLYAFFFSILVYTTLYITLAQKSFDLIYTLPDHIMTWIGGPASQVGEKTAQWGEETKGKVTEGGKDTANAEAQIGKKVAGAATMAADVAATAAGAPPGLVSTIAGGGKKD